MRSGWFPMSMGVVILINALTIGLEADETQKSRLIYRIFENVFVLIFIVELGLRVYAQGFHNFIHLRWNIFDSFLVITGMADLWLSPFLTCTDRTSAHCNNVVE